MPRALDPKATFELELDSDAAIPADRRPFFIFRPLTLGQWTKAAPLLDKISTTDSADQASVPALVEAICALLDMSCIGWGNMFDEAASQDGPVLLAYGDKRISDVLDLEEASELLQKMMAQVVPGTDDKKKFASPAMSAPSSSAAAAPRRNVSMRPTR